MESLRSENSGNVNVEINSQQQPPPQNISVPSIESSNPDENAATENANSNQETDKKGKSSKRQTSEAWLYFDKVTINGETKAVYKHCKKKLVGRASDGTTHLFAHKKRCFGAQQVDIRQYALQNSTSKDDGKVQFSNYVFDQQRARDELAKMIILHEYPLNIVEHVGFRDFCHSLQPSFVIVSQNTIRDDIIRIYEVQKEKTMKLFEKNKGRIAITSDMWTAGNQKKGYMVITGHFVDESWSLQSRIMRFIYVPCPHTSEVIGECLMNTLMDWNVDRKLSTVTLDNCSTNDAVMDIMLGRLRKTSLILNGRLFHMRCCAHILNIIVQDGLSVIGDGIKKIRNSVAHWTATPKRVEKFEATAKQLDVSCSKKLILDCKTRWNSTYEMLVVALGYRDVFPRLEQRDRLYKCLPSDDDWDLARQICDKLKIFYNVTQLFSGNKFPTANLYFPQVCQIRLAITKWLSSDIELVKAMASQMVVKYDKYWTMIHGIMGVAAILDPRYKCVLLEFYFKDIYGDEAQAQIDRIQSICNDLVKEYESKSKGDQRSSYEVDSSSSQCLSVDGIDEDPLARFDQYVNQKATSVNVKSELDRYLEEPMLPRSSEFDILAWWRTTGIRYPILQKIARDIYAIPISTVASESAFSSGGRLISPHRSRLKPDILEALMCTQNWFRANMTPECGVIPTINDDSETNESTITHVSKRQKVCDSSSTMEVD